MLRFQLKRPLPRPARDQRDSSKQLVCPKPVKTRHIPEADVGDIRKSGLQESHRGS